MKKISWIGRWFLCLWLMQSWPAWSVEPLRPLGATVLPDFTVLVEKAGPAVVNISTTKRVSRVAGGSFFMLPPGADEKDPFFDLFRRFFPQRPWRGDDSGEGNQGEEVPAAVGSGFVMSSDGFILTNRHVVDGASQIFVTLADRRELKAKLIGADQNTDIALVKVEATGLPKLDIGDPKKLRVGEWVVAIGSPFGLDNTVTAGIVSAKSRDTGDYLPFIQTDVAVNPGNSGGPLLNMNGEVVGINSQIYSRTGAFSGISFAIPIDEAIRIADQLRKTGRVVRGRIGIRLGELSREVAASLGLPGVSGALVESVEVGSPAEKGGIEQGDIVQKFNGKAVERMSDLPRLVGETKPGTRVPVQVWHRGSARTIWVTVGEVPSDAPAAETGLAAPAQVGRLGLVLADLTEEQKKTLRVLHGVFVKKTTGAAARAGLRTGDVILTMGQLPSTNQIPIRSESHFAEVLKKMDPSKPVVLLVRRGDSAEYIVIKSGND